MGSRPAWVSTTYRAFFPAYLFALTDDDAVSVEDDGAVGRYVEVSAPPLADERRSDLEAAAVDARKESFEGDAVLAPLAAHLAAHRPERVATLSRSDVYAHALCAVEETLPKKMDN